MTATSDAWATSTTSASMRGRRSAPAGPTIRAFRCGPPGRAGRAPGGRAPRWWRRTRIRRWRAGRPPRRAARRRRAPAPGRPGRRTRARRSASPRRRASTRTAPACTSSPAPTGPRVTAPISVGDVGERPVGDLGGHLDRPDLDVVGAQPLPGVEVAPGHDDRGRGSLLGTGVGGEHHHRRHGDEEPTDEGPAGGEAPPAGSRPPRRARRHGSRRWCRHPPSSTTQDAFPRIVPLRSAVRLTTSHCSACWVTPPGDERQRRVTQRGRQGGPMDLFPPRRQRTAWTTSRWSWVPST